MIFLDRLDAGRHLATKLMNHKNRPNVLVLALPRGGVPVAYEVAQALEVPMDIFLVRKLGVPGHEELAMGAIATGGVRVLNDETIDYLGIPDSVIEAITARELKELERRERAYRGPRPPPDIKGKTVILIDDGLATGSTIRAAAQALRQQEPAKIIVAVPVSAPQTCDEYRIGVEEIVCALTPEPFFGVGQWYLDFSQTSDDEVRQLLERARADSQIRNAVASSQLA
jgi:putative phosphoribosyl transferase